MALVAITGGARSGKSAVAQRMIARRAQATGAPVRVLVFGRADGSDPEFGERIARHRASRPASWQTVEVASVQGFVEALGFEGLVLIDCLGTLLGLVMEESYASSADAVDTPDGGLGEAPAHALPVGYDSAVEASLGYVVTAVLSRSGDTVVVTNEVGDGLVPTHASGRLFRDVLGRANRTIVTASDSAFLCVCGRLVDLASLHDDANWPAD